MRCGCQVTELPRQKKHKISFGGRVSSNDPLSNEKVAYLFHCFQILNKTND